MNSEILIVVVIMGTMLGLIALRAFSRMSEWKAIASLTDDEKKAFAQTRAGQWPFVILLLGLVLVYKYAPFVRDFSDLGKLGFIFGILAVYMVFDSRLLKAESNLALPQEFLEKRKRTRKFFLAFIIFSLIILSLICLLAFIGNTWKRA